MLKPQINGGVFFMKFADNVIVLLLEDEQGNLFELDDTGNVKIWSQFEQGRIFRKGKPVEVRERFSTDGCYIYDNLVGEKYLLNGLDANRLVELMNSLTRK